MKTVVLFVTLAFAQLVAAQTPIELKAKLPQIAGWTIDETVEVFDPDNLFERINGAAPGYLLFDFRELSVFVYNRNGNGDNQPYITVQVYRHVSGEDAFGIYASERPSESNFLAVGAEGYQEGSMLNFFIDCLYVKIESPSTDDDVVKTVRQIAQEFGGKVGTQPVFPAQLQSFPVVNKIPHSEQYIPTGFLGHEFLNKAFTADYQVSGKKYQLFVMDAGDTDRAKAILTRYMQFTKQNTKLREGRLTVKDKFNGNIECWWKGRYIWGIVNDNNAPVKADEILKEL